MAFKVLGILNSPYMQTYDKIEMLEAVWLLVIVRKNPGNGRMHIKSDMGYDQKTGNG